LKAFRDVLLFFLSMLLLLVAGAWAKVWIDCRAFYLSGERVLKSATASDLKADYLSAVSLYQESLSCYTPGIGYSGESLQRALSVARHFEQNRDFSSALRVYLGLQSTLLSLDMLYQPFPGESRAIGARIRELSKR
jgi:hypothetical protein